MASKQDGLDPHNAGYDQPDDPPAYRAPAVNHLPPPGYAPPTSPIHPAGQAYAYPITQNTTNVVVTTPAVCAVSQRPPLFDWTIPAILACLFCVWPIGICAIISATGARNAYRVGDYEGERSGTALARGLTLTSVILGIGCYSFLIYYYTNVYS